MDKRLVVTFLFSILNCFAAKANSSTPSEMGTKWISIPYQRNSKEGFYKNHTIMIRHLERIIVTPYGNVPTAILTHAIIPIDPKEKETLNPSAIGKIFGQVIPGKWQQKKLKNGFTHYELIPTENGLQRSVHLYLMSKDNVLYSSLSNIRLEFRVPASYEVQLFQNAFMGLASYKKKPEVATWLRFFELPVAEAAGTDIITNGLTSIVMANNPSLGPTVGRELYSLTGMAGPYNSNLRALDMTFNRGIGTFDTGTARMTRFGADLRHAGGNALRTAETFERILQPSRMFSSGAAFGTGLGFFAYFGSGIASFLADGSIAVVKSMWEWAIGKISDPDRAKIEAAVNKAFKDTQESAEQIQDIQSKLSRYGQALSYASGQPIDSVLNRLELDITAARMQKNKLEKKFNEDNAGPDCVAEVVGLEREIQRLKEIQDVLKKLPGNNKICGQINALLKSWITAQDKLHQATRVIALEINTALDRIGESDLKAQSTISDKRRRIKTCERLVDSRESVYMDQYKAMGCGNESQSPNCVSAMNQIKESLAQEKKECSENQKVTTAFETPFNLQRSSALNQLHRDIFKESLLNISASECPKGVINDLCLDGTQGSLLDLQEDMQRAIADSKRANCPSDPILDRAEKLPLSPQSLTSGLPHPAEDARAAEAALSNQNVAPAKASGGFLKETWAGVQSFFKRLFS